MSKNYQQGQPKRNRVLQPMETSGVDPVRGNRSVGRRSVDRRIKLCTQFRSGMALLVVMVLTMLIALGAYRYSFTMQAQYRVTRVHEEQVQARLAAFSGLELVATILEGTLADRESLGGVDTNPTLFQHVSLDMNNPTSQQKTATDQWFVSLVSPLPADADIGSQFSAARSRSDGKDAEASAASYELQFGLENESAKLHVPTLLQWERQFPGHARAALMRLAQAEAGPVDDWLRRQGVLPSGGVASESRLLDRLQSSTTSGDRLLSRDWFRWQWLGGDLNQNYRLDPLELMLASSLRDEATASIDSASPLETPTSSQSIKPVAWQRYLSWHNGQRNEDAAGQPRIYLNDDNLLDLHRRMLSIWPAELANFVIAIRQYGPGQPSVTPESGSGPGTNTDLAASLDSGQGAASWIPDFSQAPRYRLTSVLDLLDVRVAVPADGTQSPSASDGSSGPHATGKNRMLTSPFSSNPTAEGDYNNRLLDESTVERTQYLVGRVDIRQAPLEVLLGVPGMDQALAEQIIQQRDFANTPQTAPHSSIAWLLNDGLVDLTRLKQLEPYLTCRSDVYSTQAIGYRDSRTPVYRCTAIIDARQRPAHIIEHQSWHAWDRGFPIEQFAP